MISLFCLLGLLAGLLSACVVAPLPAEEAEEDGYAFSGPMPYRSMMPLSQIFPHPPLEGTDTVQKGSFQVDWRTQYSSILVREVDADEWIQVDGEFLRTSLVVKHGLTSNLEVGVEVPFLHYTSGFLDHVIEEFHDIFGMAQGRRDKNPDYQYDGRHFSNNCLFLDAHEDGFHAGDIPFYLKVGIVDPEEKGYGVAFRGVVELPAGDASRGFGSGRVDTGFGLLTEATILPSLKGYLGLDHVLRRDPSSFRSVRTKNVTHLSAALEKAFSSSLSMVLQSDFQTRPLKGSNLTQFKRPELTATLGCNWRITDSLGVKVYFTEGLTTDTAPDIVVGMSLGKRF